MDDTSISRDRLPEDWGADSPFVNRYGAGIRQRVFIRRLLMHENDDYDGVAIPRGDGFTISLKHCVKRGRSSSTPRNGSGARAWS